jgi:hypothetical protein
MFSCRARLSLYLKLPFEQRANDATPPQPRILNFTRCISRNGQWWFMHFGTWNHRLFVKYLYLLFKVSICTTASVCNCVKQKQQKKKIPYPYPSTRARVPPYPYPWYPCTRDGYEYETGRVRFWKKTRLPVYPPYPPRVYPARARGTRQQTTSRPINISWKFKLITQWIWIMNLWQKLRQWHLSLNSPKDPNISFI